MSPTVTVALWPSPGPSQMTDVRAPLPEADRPESTQVDQMVSMTYGYPNFLANEGWTNVEMSTLLTREVGERNLIIPVWSMGRVKWGDEGYAREELVAELGSAFLCADLEITPEVRPDHAAYIGHWLKALQDDKRLIFSAAAHAQRAADYLHGLQPKQVEEAPECVLRAMEDSDDPLPDAVAAAWAS